VFTFYTHFVICNLYVTNLFCKLINFCTFIKYYIITINDLAIYCGHYLLTSIAGALVVVECKADGAATAAGPLS